MWCIAVFDESSSYCLHSSNLHSLLAFLCCLLKKKRINFVLQEDILNPTMKCSLKKELLMMEQHTASLSEHSLMKAACSMVVTVLEVLISNIFIVEFRLHSESVNTTNKEVSFSSLNYECVVLFAFSYCMP